MKRDPGIIVGFEGRCEAERHYHCSACENALHFEGDDAFRHHRPFARFGVYEPVVPSTRAWRGCDDGD